MERWWKEIILGWFSQKFMRKRLKKIFINTENFNPLNNFAHRIQEVSDDIKHQLIQNLKNCKNLSSALNEFCIIRHSPWKLWVYSISKNIHIYKELSIHYLKIHSEQKFFYNFPPVKEEFQLEIEKFVSIVRGTLAI